MKRTVAAVTILATMFVADAVQAQPMGRSELTTVAPLSKWLNSNPQIEALRKALVDPAQKPSIRIESETSSGSKVLTVLVGGSTFQAVSIPTARLDALTDAVTRRVVEESPSERSALLELRSEFSAQSTSAIKGLGLFSSESLTEFALNPTQGSAESLKVNEAFAFALERAQAKDVSLSIEQLQKLPASSRLVGLAARRPALSPFATSYGQAMSALSDVLASPGPASKAAFVNSARATRQAFIDSWPSLRNDPEARSLAVRSLDGLAGQSELKAVYGVSSNFEPVSYRGIYLQSMRAVAIKAPDGQIVCSGVALSDRWVMTAGHCFVGRAWQAMKIVFPKPDGSLGEALNIKQQWPDPAPGSHSGDSIDYAFVRVDPSTALTAPMGAADAAAQAAGVVRPICLRQDQAGYEEAVFVIGYAADSKLVYDHAYVWYPFRLFDSEFLTVEAMTGARLQRLAEAFYPTSPTSQEAFVQSNLKSFDDAYGTRVGAGAMVQHEYRGRALDVLADRPMFGFDTDTQSGNSGGPVYSHKDVCVVGVFGGGRPDNVKIAEATWKEHEFGTPLSAVLQDLKTHDPASIPDPTDRANIAALLADIAKLLR